MRRKDEAAFISFFVPFLSCLPTAKLAEEEPGACDISEHAGQRRRSHTCLQTDLLPVDSSCHQVLAQPGEIFISTRTASLCWQLADHREIMPLTYLSYSVNEIVIVQLVELKQCKWEFHDRVQSNSGHISFLCEQTQRRHVRGLQNTIVLQFSWNIITSKGDLEMTTELYVAN